MIKTRSLATTEGRELATHYVSKFVLFYELWDTCNKDVGI